MAVRVHLWKGERLVAVTDEADEPSAVRKIDLLLTEVHQGRYGPGTFEIDALWVDQQDLVLRALAQLRGIAFPAPP